MSNSEEPPNPYAIDPDARRRGFTPGMRLFGRFLLVSPLGAGGVGEVWMARDERLQRDVALKLLPGFVVRDPVSIIDLKRETNRSLLLSHPHIVRVNDFLEDEVCGLAAISMEYIDGGSLAGHRAKRPHRCLEVEELRPWMRQLCTALDYAHTRARIVHRALHPANLMLTAGGELKVADFGIARSLMDAAARLGAPAAAGGGAVACMSPEQTLGQPATVPDDIYSLGATLYDLLTGQPPFYTGNIQEQIKQAAPLSIAERRRQLGVEGMKGVPPAWESTIAACLEKDAAQRPRSAGEVLRRLGGGPAGMPPTLPLAADRGRETRPGTGRGVYAAVFVLLLLLAAGGWFLQKQFSHHDSASIADPPPLSPPPSPASAPEVMLLLDTSGSMSAEDFHLGAERISRFELLRRNTTEFIRNHPRDSIGLVAFAGNAYVLSRPTSDHAKLIEALTALKVGGIGEDGTAIGSAIVAGYGQLSSPGVRKRILVLITDGANNSGFIAPLTAAEYLGAQKIELLVVALGRTGVAPVPVLDPFGRKVYRDIRVEVDEAALKQLADSVHGEFRAAPDAAALSEAFLAFEAIEAKAVVAPFTAAVPARFSASYGVATAQAGALVLTGLATPAPSPLQSTLHAAPPASAASPAPAAPTSRAPAPPLPSSRATPLPSQSVPATGVASSPAAYASLSATTTSFGVPVQLTIGVSGASDFPQPAPFAIDGFQVDYLSASTRLNITNGIFQRSRQYIYQLNPGRVGMLAIPALTVSADGRQLQTAPMNLIVDAAHTNGNGAEFQHFGEIVIASPNAKVGQEIGVELQMAITSRLTWQPTAIPNFLPEGFICEKMSEPVRSTTTVHGITYDTLTFHTSLTPLKSGRLTLGPVTFEYRVRKPAQTSLGDLFADPASGPIETRKLQAPAVTLEVAPAD